MRKQDHVPFLPLSGIVSGPPRAGLAYFQLPTVYSLQFTAYSLQHTVNTSLQNVFKTVMFFGSLHCIV